MIQCPHRPACDGCPLFEADQATAADAKLGAIRRAFEPYPELERHAPSSLSTADTLGYRNRARMAVKNGRPGFYTAGSREHLPIEICKVHRPEVEALIDAVRPHLAASPLREAVQYIDVRVGEYASVVTFVVNRDDGAIRGSLAAVAAGLDAGVSIAIGDDSGAVMPNAPEVVSEPGSAIMLAGTLALEAPPQAFYQVNDDALAVVHAAMRDMLGETELIVDAYCGVGTHGLVLAEGRKVVGFDVSKQAIEAARRNAKNNSVDGKFVATGAADLSDWEWPGGAFATIANPARAGLTPEFVAAAAASPTTQILYLSCEPQTLARDLDRLARRGFVVAETCAYDMMPRTEQVESLVRLERTEAPERIYEGAHDDHKSWPAGVSGPLKPEGKLDHTTWFARLAGKVPHGQPPTYNGRTVIDVRRLRNVGDQSVARIDMQGGDVTELRKRLRDWGYPVVGDTDHGVPAVNAYANRNLWVDRLLLHCARAQKGDETFDADVPGELVPYFRLPPHKLQP